MRQVPEKLRYLIIGRGRLARHIGFYFSFKKISHTLWNRTHSEADLRRLFDECDVVLLGISDANLSSFLREHSYLLQKQVVHCSGATVLKDAWGVHPLMSFGENLYSKSLYEAIPWVVEGEVSRFHEIFPELSNPVFSIPIEKKALYHALCVLSGNFTTLVWDAIFERAEVQLGLPRSIFFPYMNQIASNVQEFGGKSLTGPLVRGDLETISVNLQALKEDPLSDIYHAMIRFYHYEYEVDHQYNLFQGGDV